MGLLNKQIEVAELVQDQYKDSNSLHVVLAGGGTAGHVNPLLSVAHALKDLDESVEISVIGTNAGLEKTLVPKAGLPLDVIEKVPFPRKPNLYMLKFPFKWIRETRKVAKILEKRHANIVVGFGGYASAPVYAQAHRMHLPIVIHEQNARAGMANKLGARWASMIGCVYDGTGLIARAASNSKAIRVGLPLRKSISDLCAKITQDIDLARFEGAKNLGLDPSRPIILVTGGSLGAKSINEAVSIAAGDLLKCAQIVHLTGSGKSKEVKDNVARSAGLNQINDIKPEHAGLGDYHICEYLERIDWAFACADLVICRSGAGTVAEVSAIGVPAVYVPLPIGNGEQRFNAQPVANAGGAIIVNDCDFSDDWIRANVLKLLNNPDELCKMREKAWKYGIRNAARVMAEHILKIAKESKE